MKRKWMLNNCKECARIYESLTEEDMRRGVGDNKGHILSKKGDCPQAWNPEPGEAQINRILRERNALKAQCKEMLSALELAEGWIDSKREDERTGDGHQGKFVLDSIRVAIKTAKGGA